MTDELHDLDLGAWESPPPPKGLADAVIARVRATDDAIAVALRARRRRRAITAAACIGTIAASLALWLGLRASTRTRAAGDDIYIATEPRQIAIGATEVELDEGTLLRVHRDGHQLRAVQFGTATWQVADTDTLVIEAGSASIEATGARLRVEATMNTPVTRVATGVALTAAAVSLVSVAVYEGRAVKTDRGQTTILQPRSPVVGQAMPAPGPTAPGPTAIAAPHGLAPRHGEVAIAAGESPVIFSTRDRLAIEIQHTCQPVPLGQTAAFEVKMALAGRPSEHLDHPIPVIPDAGSTDATSAWYTLIAGTYTYTATCSTVIGTGTIEVRLDSCRAAKCADDADRLVKLAEPGIGAVFGGGNVHVAGTVVAGTALSIGTALATVDPHDGFAFDLHADVGQAIAVRADHATRGTQFYVQFSESASGPATLVPPDDSCDEVSCLVGGGAAACCAKYGRPATQAASCEDYKKAAIAAMGNGKNADALKLFEQSYQCKPDGQTLHLAFMTACNVPDVPRARYWWKRLSGEEQNHYVQMCIRRGIGRAQLEGDYDGSSRPPDALDRDMIMSAVARIHRQLVACGRKFPSASGKVKIRVEVGAEGGVTSSKIETSPDPGLGACVQDAMSIATFPETMNGGTFGYPFVFPM